jgi:putative component of membrane protein insertase Oxa1/YidC/SpoIIIJ protein YidD
VVREFGAVKGGWMAFKRVLRCGPWTPMGTEDPPPVRSKFKVQEFKAGHDQRLFTAR